MRKLIGLILVVLATGLTACGQTPTQPEGIETPAINEGTVEVQSSPKLTLKRAPEQIITNQWREWFKAEYAFRYRNCPAPTFTVSPQIDIEGWSDNPSYGWIVAFPGTYTIKATSTVPACEAKASLVIQIL